MGSKAPDDVTPEMQAAFRNNQEFLDREAPRVIAARKAAGVDDLVSGIMAVIINVEPDRQRPAVEEFLRYTGLEMEGVYEGELYITALLQREASASILVRSRRPGVPNPFASLNDHPKSRHLPNTRLETYVFQTPDIRRLVEIQRGRGVEFLTEGIIDAGHYSFIQTPPSRLSANSLGFVQFHDEPRHFLTAMGKPVDWPIRKPDRPHLRNIGRLDHVATRLTAEHRDPAILEFLHHTGYRFDFSIYVRLFNSITNVTRRGGDDVALVFTSGIAPYVDEAAAGPTEKFVHNYGARTHHLAFHTEDIEATYAALGRDGMEFMVELVGAREEGLKQTFTQPSPHTLLVNEYIHRYGGFDGFFTRSNVTALTAATDRQ